MKNILRALCAMLLAAAGLAAIQPAMAQTFPARPVRLIVVFAPGGPTDLTARTVSAKMGEVAGQPFVVENIAGANGAIGTQAAARAAPDGYTILFSTPSATSVALALYGEKLGFDLFNDITPVGMIVNNTQMLVTSSSLGVNSVAELVKLAKSRPGQLNYGSVGVGSSSHLAIELLKSMAGIDMLHVPYNGVAPVMKDLLGGRVQLLLTSMATVIPQVRSGKIVGLAVGTPARSRAAPDIPTMVELGYAGFLVPSWNAFFAPARTPANLVARINDINHQALADPKIAKMLADQGGEAAPSTPEFVTNLMREEYARWKKVIGDARIVPE